MRHALLLVLSLLATPAAADWRDEQPRLDGYLSEKAAAAERSCAAGRSEECRVARGVRDLSNFLDQAWRECQDGDAAACRRLHLAAATYDRLARCESGDAAACTAYEGMRADIAGCRVGDAAACARLADAAPAPTRPPGRLERAPAGALGRDLGERHRLDRACQAGQAPACAGLRDLVAEMRIAMLAAEGDETWPLAWIDAQTRRQAEARADLAELARLLPACLAGRAEICEVYRTVDRRLEERNQLIARDGLLVVQMNEVERQGFGIPPQVLEEARRNWSFHVERMAEGYGTLADLAEGRDAATARALRAQAGRFRDLPQVAADPG